MFPIPQTALITSGTSLSAAIPLGECTLIGVAMPAAGWDAAGLSFQVSVDGGTTWLNLFDESGSEIAPAAAAGTFIQLDPVLFTAVNHIKVRSGTSGTPVTQNADRTLTLITRPI